MTKRVVIITIPWYRKQPCWGITNFETNSFPGSPREHGAYSPQGAGHVWLPRGLQPGPTAEVGPQGRGVYIHILCIHYIWYAYVHRCAYTVYRYVRMICKYIYANALQQYIIYNYIYIYTHVIWMIYIYNYIYNIILHIYV